MIVASGASITNPWKTLLMYQLRCFCVLLTCLLSTVSAWGNCSDEERMEMQRLGLEESVIAYTCDEEVEIIMEAPSLPPPVIVQERPVLDQTVGHSIGHRQQVSIGVGVADGFLQQIRARYFAQWNCNSGSVPLARIDRLYLGFPMASYRDCRRCQRDG